MSSFRDICRICLQEILNKDAETIDLKKFSDLLLKPFMKFSFVNKWNLNLFENHLICSTCRTNFNTLKLVYRLANISKATVYKERNKMGGIKFNLTRLKRFSHLENNPTICRLCLSITDKASFYLFDSPTNILPPEYIQKMLKFLKIYLYFDHTINPIMCHNCWLNIQIAYSFTKQMEEVTKKIMFYNSLTNKSDLDRTDLKNILEVCQDMDMNQINPEHKVIIKKETKQETKIRYSAHLGNIQSPVNLRSPGMKQNFSNFFEDHFDLNGDNNDDSPDMPLLTPVIDKTIDLNNSQINYHHSDDTNVKLFQRKKKKKRKTNKGRYTEKIEVISTTSEGNRYGLASIQENKHIEPCHQPKKRGRKKGYRKPKVEEINRFTENSFLNRLRPRTIQKVEKETLDDSYYLDLSNNRKNMFEESHIINKSKHSSRQSAKEKTFEDSYPEDLLVLSREEIIKTKIQKRKINNVILEHTSTPKIIRTQQRKKMDLTSSLSRPNLISEHNIFENSNINHPIEIKKELIEEEELQIKRETLNENESNERAESVEFVLLDDCPSLEAFIKFEPLEDYPMREVEDQPPELEFQGPCHSVSSTFTLQNTYSDDDNSFPENNFYINTVDEKRNIFVLETNLPTTRKNVITIEDTVGQESVAPIENISQSSSLDINQEVYTEQNEIQNSLSKVTGDASKKTVVAPSVKDSNCLKVPEMCDNKLGVRKLGKMSNKPIPKLKSHDGKSKNIARGKVIQCPFCPDPVVMINRQMMKNHVCAHALIGQYLYSCWKCLLITQERSVFLDHMKKNHPKE